MNKITSGDCPASGGLKVKSMSEGSDNERNKIKGNSGILRNPLKVN